MEIESRRPSKAFGWGAVDTRFYSTGEEPVRSWVEKHFPSCSPARAKSRDLAQVKLEPTKLPDDLIKEFCHMLGPEYALHDRESRAFYSGGKSYRDLLRMQSLQVRKAPDIVLRPKSESELNLIMKSAAKHHIALIPFAGGSSVVGGLDPLRGTHSFSAAVDLTRMNRVISFDEDSCLVTAEAGIYGPELEKWLNERGYTLGHFPQSFEYSTLGGWVSARSSGQNSVKYGSIDKMVSHLRILTPVGSINTQAAPNMACGPDLMQIMTGSEGVFGFITRCALRVVPVPQAKNYTMLLFHNFEEAGKAARLLLQSESQPAMIRVSDEEETASLMALRSDRSKGASSRIKQQIGTWWLEKKGFHLNRAALMLLGFEGSPACNRFQQKLAWSAMSDISWQSLGPGSGNQWLKDRFFLPYARDTFMEAGLLVDTFETATYWHNYRQLYLAVRESVSGVCNNQKVPFTLFCHLSHLYKTGTSLYFTIICQAKAMPLEQWLEIKSAASEAICREGGAISHHHGVGTDHKPWLTRNKAEQQLMSGIKKTLDPDCIMNPGKLLC